MLMRAQIDELRAFDGHGARILSVYLDRSPGGECPNCGRLEASPVASCPACGARMRPLHDVVRRAIERALEEADRVAVVHGDAAPRLREVGAGLGALLRYR